MTGCPPVSFDIFTIELCPWPYAHILAPLTVYLHLRNVWITLAIVVWFEVLEHNVPALIGSSGNCAIQDLDHCECFDETLSDSLIGDWWMGVAGTFLGVLLVWATDAERFVSLRRWWVMLIEIVIEIIPNVFYGVRFGGAFWMVFVRPAVVALVELLGWRYWHDKGSLQTIIAWIAIEGIFVGIYFLSVGGSFYNRAFMAIGVTLIFIMGLNYVYEQEKMRRSPRRAILGFTFLCEEEKEKVKTL